MTSSAGILHGERLTLSVVELEPGAIAETHSHDHEQLGMVLRGPRSEWEQADPGESGPGRWP